MMTGAASSPGPNKLIARIAGGKSVRMTKTVTVVVEQGTTHALYGKVITRSSRYHAHDDSNDCKEGDLVTLRLPSSEMRIVRAECRATVGTLSNSEHENITVGKAGRPIHDDARAKIRPRIFLEGNFFVDLEPGTPGVDRKAMLAT